ncbi:MAG: hypothetical protein WC676_01020 [Candidatus Omnitrophota bacterium]
MKKKIMVIGCCLLFSVSVLGFARNEKSPRPNMSAYEHANEKAKFKRTRDEFNSKKNKEIRAEKIAEKEVIKEEKKKEASQDNGKGQFKVKF